MNEPNRLSSFGHILTDEGISESDYKRLQSLGMELETLYSKSLSQAKAIDASSEYTEQGKARQKHKLTKEIQASLSKYDKMVHKEMAFVDGESWALELRKLREGMQAREPEIDPILKELQFQERRKYLLELDPAERESVIQGAANRGDYSLLDAAVSGPQPSHTFVHPKSREILEGQRLRSLNPKASERIEQIERSQRTLQGMVSSLKSALRKQDLFSEPEQGITFLNAG